MRRAPRAGFTLAEVAVTIVIVGTMLIYLLQGLNGTKLLAAHTRNTKLARELALEKLGQVGSGEFQEDIESGLVGSFAEEGYPDFSFEVIVGDESFRELDPARGRFDSWNPPNREEKTSEEEEAEIQQPFEKVKIRITFPKIQEFQNELILEQWFPWTQVYGKTDEEAAAGTQDPASGQPDGTGSAGTQGNASKSRP